MNTWWEYVTRVSGRASQSEIARRVGLSAASVNRWQRSAPHPDNVREFAIAYRRPVIEAMVAAGIMTEDDISEATPAKVRPPELPVLRDDVERAIWGLTDLSEDTRLALLAVKRARVELEDDPAPRNATG